jgi:pyruvate dehydrogenase E2 component (dihydrolipoamide acetyltransferase)
MAQVTFRLPDLGEGLAEATVLEWFVAEGDEVAHDAPMVEVDTAKAAVEIPAPVSGRVVTLHAAEGETVAVGAPLITFEGEERPGIVGTVPQEEKPRRRVRLRKPGE